MGATVRPKSHHLDLVLAPASLRQVISRLQPHPQIGGRAKRLFQPDCHLGRDAASSVDQVIERGTGDTENSRSLSDRQAQGGKTFFANHLAGVWGILHWHCRSTSVEVDQIDIERIAMFEPEQDPPVAGNRQ
jgi:hypothetical protein